jgi:hypothetical protein
MLHECPYHTSSRKRRRSDMVGLEGTHSNYVLEAAPGIFYEGPFQPDTSPNRDER